RRPIAELLARPDLDPTLRERLELVRAVRAFAAGPLGLRVGNNYATFAELDGDTTAYVLSAAYRDRLAPYTWWYPVVGRVPYQGFFERSAAEAAGRRLAARALDVEVRPAVAFSTLGWFADPLLSTVAQAPPVALADAAAETLVRRGLGRREELVPPNNARLLGELVYGTDLDVFDRLAERDADLGPALRALVRAGRDGDALARVREAARLREGTALD